MFSDIIEPTMTLSNEERRRRYRTEHRDKILARNREWYKRNRKKRLVSMRRYSQSAEGKIAHRRSVAKYYQKVLERNRQWNKSAEGRKFRRAQHRLRFRHLRDQVVDRLGNICARCRKISYRMHIHHKNGRGGKHRSSFKGNVMKYYQSIAKLSDRSLKSRYEYLCHKCHQKVHGFN